MEHLLLTYRSINIPVILNFWEKEMMDYGISIRNTVDATFVPGMKVIAGISVTEPLTLDVEFVGCNTPSLSFWIFPPGRSLEFVLLKQLTEFQRFLGVRTFNF